MSKKGHVFIERRDNGKYAIMHEGNQRASGLYDTQAEAIAEARRMFPGIKPDVERQRHTSSGDPDKWRK